MNRDKVKVVLPRSGPDEFWQLVEEHFAGEDLLKWKYLAMLALRENAGWPLDQIGRVFQHPKGHVTRCLEAIKRELRGRFAVDSSPRARAADDEEEGSTCSQAPLGDTVPRSSASRVGKQELPERVFPSGAWDRGR